MLSSLGLAATAIGPALFIIATCVALGTVLATWARIPPASAMQPAGGHRDTITITIRNTTVAAEGRHNADALIYRPAFAATKPAANPIPATPFAGHLRDLRAAA